MKACVVEIVSEKVNSRSGTNERGFWSVRSQEAFLHQGGAYPLPFELQLPENVPGYAPGRYMFGEGAYRAGRYGLEFSRQISLVSLAEVSAELATSVPSKVRAA